MARRAHFNPSFYFRLSTCSLPATHYSLLLLPMNSVRTLSREVLATQIPSGEKSALPAGTRITISQRLGGSYTVATDFGLFRVEGRDAEAIGETVVDTAVKAPTLAGGAPDPEAIWSQLRQVFDPEIPVNIVDLGLVYSMDVASDPTAGYRVDVAMTLTAPGCGMLVIILSDTSILTPVLSVFCTFKKWR